MYFAYICILLTFLECTKYKTILICHLLSIICQREWQIYLSERCWSKALLQPVPKLLLYTTLDKNLEKELSIDFPNLFCVCFNKQYIRMQYPYQKSLPYKVSYISEFIYAKNKQKNLSFYKYLPLNPHLIWSRKQRSTSLLLLGLYSSSTDSETVS